TYEVTQAEFAAVTGHNPSDYKKAGDNDVGRYPVESVTWNEAVAFCKKLSERAEEKVRKYRLPTEAEWEYACRAGTTTPFSLGDSLGEGDARFDWDVPYGSGLRGESQKNPGPVDEYAGKANAWGLVGMHGNVREWCADAYAPLGTKGTVEKQGSSR